MKGEVKVFLPGQMIFREGDQSNGLFFIKEGRVEIYRVRDAVEVSLSILGPGEVLGTVTVMNREPRSASARAQTQVNLVFVSSAALEVSMKEVPVWTMAVLKDAIARLRNVDDRLCDAKVLEKELQGKVGGPFHHASQLASFLAAMVRVGTVDDDGILLFPTKGFVERAELVLFKRAEYLQKIFDTFPSGGLVKLVENKKFGPSLQTPKAELVEGFANFCRTVAKEGAGDFAPTKLYPFMSSMLRVYKKNPTVESWLRKDLAEAMGKDLGRTDVESIVPALVEAKALRVLPGTNEQQVAFSALQVQNRIIFEGVCRLVKELVKELGKEEAVDLA